MKQIAVPLVLVLSAGLASAATPNRLAAKSATATQKADKADTTKAKGEVVSTEGDKLVLKTSSGEETFTASGKLATQLKAFHAGDEVVVHAHNNELVSVKHAKTKKA